MRQLHVLSFGLGHAASLPLKPELLDFYRWLGGCVTGENCEWIAQNHQSIPIENETISNNSGLVYSRFWESLEGLGQATDILIVDLTTLPHGVVRGTVMLHLASAITTLLSTPDKLRQSPEGRVVLLLPHVPPAQEAFRKSIESHIENGRIVLIGDDGQVAPIHSVRKPFDTAQYRMKLSGVREDPNQLLQMKMVRRLGHFRRSYQSGPSACVRYLYDGELCRAELVTLFRKHITRTYGPAACPLVIYEPGALHWLEDAVLAMSLTTKIECQTVQNALSIQPSKKADLLATPPLLVIPMIDSGDAAANVLTRLRSEGSLPKPHVLAVLTTRLTDVEKKVRDLTISGEKYPVHCLMQVEQRRWDNEKTCPMCCQRIPHSELAQETYAMLTTYDFWDMVDAAGWQAEDPVPTGRKAMEAVPNFQKLIDQNGPWLASKIRHRLDSVGEGMPADPIVVCPDEPASVLYTDYLRLLGRVSTVIRIPRTVIDACNESADYAALSTQWQGSDWHLQISSVSARELIVMDEFNYSGGTRTNMYRLLQHFGKRVLFYFSLVDFNPAGADDFSASTYALYEWQVFERQGQGVGQS